MVENGGALPEAPYVPPAPAAPKPTKPTPAPVRVLTEAEALRFLDELRPALDVRAKLARGAQ